MIFFPERCNSVFEGLKIGAVPAMVLRLEGNGYDKEEKDGGGFVEHVDGVFFTNLLKWFAMAYSIPDLSNARAGNE
jgi:hypothetical protein